MINSTLTTRTRRRHFAIELPDEVVKELVGKNDERIDYYARLWLSSEKQNYSSLRDYCDFVASIMKGLAPIPEIKRELRNRIRWIARQEGGAY